MRRFDYIISGAGAAGLSLLVRMIDSGKFVDKKILLLDKAGKTENDRTWCFWEKEAGVFEPVVYKRWQKLWFHGNGKSTLHDIGPYEYKLIRGIDFYNFCFRLIATQSNITIQYTTVEGCYSDQHGTFVVASGEKIEADYIFNSILFDKIKPGNGEHYLLQHFKGWYVETAAPSFKPGEASLMDFRTPQNQATTFVYVMPFSETRALVEYTLFSRELVPGEVYDTGLRAYCEDILGLEDYKITSEEFGVIPMTNYSFGKVRHRVVNIGTAGGQTKASSGYTFQFIQKQSEIIVQALIANGKPYKADPFGYRRFNFYDSVLLNILSGNKYPGEKIFSLLFETNKMKDVFKFLDNQTTLPEELKIIRKLPKKIFLKAAIEQSF